MSRETQLQAALARVPTMGQDQLKATRRFALSWGEEAAPLLAAIDARLTGEKSARGDANASTRFRAPRAEPRCGRSTWRVGAGI